MECQRRLFMATICALCFLIGGQVFAQSQAQDSSQVFVNVITSSTLVRGLKSSLNSDNSRNSTIYKFLSVPYAKAPVGQLRFKQPVELERSQEANTKTLVDATKFAATCPQHKHLARFISPLLNLDQEHQISEDCLHLSIYVPATVGTLISAQNYSIPKVLKPNEQLPVIVWIPGEGFDFADARQFDGSQLAQRTQSVVVSVQYRVGLLGFLDAPQLNITGNMGLYDQVAALKWVKRNIAAFGGDEERITLMGRFSGAMSISTLLTAPRQDLVQLENGRSLFNRVALLSGIAVGDWIIERQNQADKLDALNKLVLERNLCSSAQLDNGSCLRELPLEQLLEIYGYGWKLVSDDKLVGRLDPIETLQNNLGQKLAGIEAILLGETDTEGTLCLYRHMLNQQSKYAQLISDNSLAPGDLYELIRDDSLTYFKLNISQVNPILTALEATTTEVTTNRQTTASELRNKYLNACSSYMVKSHSIRFKRLLEARNKLIERNSSGKPIELHHYSLKYKPSFSLAPNFIKTAAHGDDVPLIFGLVHNLPEGSQNVPDLLATNKMMSYIANFVHGNHPLLQQQQQQHNAIQQQQTKHQTADEPLDTRADDRANWASMDGNGHIYSIDLSQAEVNEISNNLQTFQRDQTNESDIDYIREKDLIKLFGQHKQQEQQTNQLKVIIVDGRQMISMTTNDNNAEPLNYANDKMIATSLTRSQNLLDLHRRQQSIDGSTLLIQQRSQVLLSTEGNAIGNGRQQTTTASANIKSTSSAANASNLLGATDLSLMLLFMLSSCLVVLTMMAICIALIVLVLRCFKWPAYSSQVGASVPTRRLAAAAAAGLQAAARRSSQQFNSSSSTCNIYDDTQVEAVLNGAHKKCDDRPFCNVFAKLRNQQQTRVNVTPVSHTGDMILQSRCEPTETPTSQQASRPQ